MTLHAVVVRQPWASLIAQGTKTVETRGFAPKSTVRPGDRLAIVAGLTAADYAEASEAWDRLAAELDVPLFRLGRQLAGLFHRPAPGRPLGAVVAVVTYDNAWPIVNDLAWCDDGGVGIGGAAISLTDGEDGGLYLHNGDHFGCGGLDIPDQFPLGDFTPGRYGWMLSNPLRLTVPVPCPAKAHDGSRTHMQGVFRLPAAVEAAVVAQIGGES